MCVCTLFCVCVCVLINIRYAALNSCIHKHYAYDDVDMWGSMDTDGPVFVFVIGCHLLAALQCPCPPAGTALVPSPCPSLGTVPSTLSAHPQFDPLIMEPDLSGTSTWKGEGMWLVPQLVGGGDSFQNTASPLPSAIPGHPGDSQGVTETGTRSHGALLLAPRED